MAGLQRFQPVVRDLSLVETQILEARELLQMDQAPVRDLRAVQRQSPNLTQRRELGQVGVAQVLMIEFNAAAFAGHILPQDPAEPRRAG